MPLSVKVLIAFVLAAGPAYTAQLSLPAPSTDPLQAAQAFDARSRAIVVYAACSLEAEFLKIRAEIARDNYEHQGEDLTSILLAKLAFARAREAECRVTVPRGGVPPFVEGDGATDAQRAAYYAARIPGFPACARSIGGTAQLSYTLTAQCIVQQVNETIRAMRKEGLMGTAGTYCVIPPRIATTGDFDVNVRELVRILYYAGNAQPGRSAPLLETATVKHMYENLLAARGKPAPDDYSVVHGCGDIANEELGSPEDTADRREFPGEVLEALGDVGEWALRYWLALLGFLGFAAAAASGGLLGLPLALAGATYATAGTLGTVSPVLPFADVRIGETENHRLMIESSRFLTNQAIITELERKRRDVDGIKTDQAKVKTWLLERLARIAREDFEEYNSRPYTRYSLEALINLHDFSEDSEVRLAAHNVLDLSAAKFAIVGNRGRRIVPFRRLDENDGRSGTPPEYLYNIASGVDHEVARAMVLSGQTQLFGPFPDNDPAPRTMVNTAISTYRLPPVVQSLAIDRATPFEQTIQHAAVERVYRSRPFTLSAGGLRSGPTIEGPLGIGTRDTDRGVAMPTVLLPTSSGLFQYELIAFDGVGLGWERSENTCVARTFACGLNPRWGTLLSGRKGCIVPGSPKGVSFVSTAVCGLQPPHFYAALLTLPCDGRLCAAGATWGLLEALEPPVEPKSAVAADDPFFQQFMKTRGPAMAAAVASIDKATHTFTYRVGADPLIRARVAFPRAEIVSLGTLPAPVPATMGRLSNNQPTGLRRLANGHYLISAPATSASLEIDMRNPAAPARKP